MNKNSAGSRLQEWFQALAAPVPWTSGAIMRIRMAGIVVLLMLVLSYGVLWEALKGKLSLMWAGLGELLALSAMVLVFAWAIARRRKDVAEYQSRRS